MWSLANGPGYRFRLSPANGPGYRFGLDLANGTGYTVSSLGTVLLAMQYWYHAPLDDAVTTMGA